ncbi:MAG: GTP cyclohydrolase I type 1, partial [uncultured Blastococcus sp.]
ECLAGRHRPRWDADRRPGGPGQGCRRRAGAAARHRRGPGPAGPAGHPGAGGARLHRDLRGPRAGPLRDPLDDVRRGPRRDGPGQGHPDVLHLRAPPGALPRSRPHRLHPGCRRAGDRAVEAGPAGRGLRPPAPAPGTHDPPDRGRALRGAQAPGRDRGDRGRAPVHGDAGDPQAGIDHDDLRRPRRLPGQPGDPRRGDEPGAGQV